MFTKILPIIFTPLMSVVILLITSINSNSKITLKAGTLLLIIFSLGITSDFLWFLAEKPWKRIQFFEIEKGDAIVVLSGSMSVSQSQPNNWDSNNAERFFAGIELLKEKVAPNLIFSAGPIYKNSEILEGVFYLEKAISLGLPQENIFITKPVINTAQEAKFISSLTKDLDLPKPAKIILVTSAFHMSRAKNLFEKEHLEVIPYPVNFQNREIKHYFSLQNIYNWIPTARNLASSSRIIREFLAIIYYKMFN